MLVHAERSGVARFAASVVHQPTLIDNAVVRIRVVRDGKIGWAATNRGDADGLAEVARRAGEAADSARPDPDFPGFAPPAEYQDVGGYDEETASLGAEDQARLAGSAIEAAPDFGLYGYFTSGVTELAVASATGLSAAQTVTDAVCICLAATDDASGWSERTSWRVGDIDPAEPAREAAATAAQTRGAQELEPGTYAAVLEPFAVAELVRWFSYDSMGAQGYLEERSYFCGRHRRAGVRPEDLDRRRRARRLEPAEGVRLRGDAEAARRDDRGRRHPRRRLGPGDRGARR